MKEMPHIKSDSLRINAMNKIKVIVSLILLGTFVYMTACKKKDPSPQDVVKTNLIGPLWKIKTVTVDGVDYTNSYLGMSIIFTATSYTTTNGGVVWPSPGTWQFTSSDGSKMVRGDGKEVSITVTATQLDLSLNWPATTFAGGRSNSLKGNHKFTFTK